MRRVYYAKTKQERDELVEMLNKEYPFVPYMTQINIDEIKDDDGNFMMYKIVLSTASLD